MRILTYLRQNDHRRPRLGHVHNELGAVVIGRPWNIQCSPLLSDRPLGTKETGSVKVLVLPQEILVRDPKELWVVSTTIRMFI